MSARIRGSLCFENGNPLHHIDFSLIRKRHLFTDRILATGQTNLDGSFDISLAPDETLEPASTVKIAVSDSGRVVVETDARVTQNASDNGFDLGRIPVRFWPYDLSFPLPRAGKTAIPLQVWAKSTTKALKAMFKEVKPRYIKLLLKNKLLPSKLTYQQIQHIPGEVGTTRLEAKSPGCTRSDEFLGERVLNGENTVLLLGKDKNQDGLLRCKISWGDFACKNSVHDLADVDASFKKHGNGIVPVRIKCRIRVAQNNGSIKEIEGTPDHPDWEEIKRVFRCSFHLQGAMFGHAVQQHLRVEEYTVPIYRNLRLNPIRNIFQPHIKHMAITNIDGGMQEIVDPIVETPAYNGGPNGMLIQQSALSTAQARRLLLDFGGRSDWMDWRPREPLTEGHAYAKAGQLFWDILSDWVNTYIQDNRSEIVKHWAEVHRFSQDLVAHSVPYLPLDEDPDVAPLDNNELYKDDLPRVFIDGVERAIRPVTQSDTPQEQDIENLAQVCKFVIYHATFNHDWAHEATSVDGGEPLYASFYLRNGSLGKESDLSIAPNKSDSIFFRIIAQFGQYRWGLILSNEDGDIPSGLRDRLTAASEKFNKIGVEVKDIRARIDN
ncbi:hypothetical protein N9C62_02850 [Luminiphilus sp.]|nr:hypothetical protein [Luminiphilus sp.]